MGCLILVDKVIRELLERSNRLGSNPKFTNYAGGNTSAKSHAIDPLTGSKVEVIYVKGSGGDLGTLTEKGLATLYLDRLRGMTSVYRGLEHEDEMVSLFDFCSFGKSGAAPSIDTAMHGLVTQDHVDHLHPDSIIAFATSKDGRELTKKCFGDEILGVDWRRPGFELGLEISKIAMENPQAHGCVLGGHGLTTWGKTSKECEERTVAAILKAEEFIASAGKIDPLGKVVVGRNPLSKEVRISKAAKLAPTLRGIASRDNRMVGHFNDADVVMEFLSSEKLFELAAKGTSCPDHFLRTKISPLVIDLDSNAGIEEVIARAHELHAEYRTKYTDYYNKYSTKESPAIRGADPLIILVPGVGMFSYGKDKQTARVAGEFYVNAINVMRGAEAISTYSPITESEKFKIEYWELEEAKLRRMPKPKALQGRIALVTGGGSGIGKATAHRLSAEGASVIVADRDLASAQGVANELGGSDSAIAIAVDVTDEDQVCKAIDAGVLAFGGIDLAVNNAGLSISKPLVETTSQDWDLQHDVMARGSFLVSRESAKAMIAAQMGGDIVYISSKNAVFAGPNNVAYGSTKADQAHQVRLLAAELGAYGIRVNGVNPDGVVKGSGIFASGWGAQRAEVYGVAEDKLGEYYAQRTILKKEVLPDHIAAAVFVLCANDLPLTTGLHIPVDGGVAAAFLR